MDLSFREVSFSTHAHIKNIIGKELINDDNVAILELVKNSYDAGATKVNIKFKNLININGKISELIIIDNGTGMSEKDVLTKWLNIAYSSKKDNHTQNNRYQAGNKGVGRFSCDRLGKKLNIFTKQKNKQYIHLQISWKDFEEANNIDTQIQDVPVLIRTINDSEFKEKSGFEAFEEGTIIQISDLNESWLDFNKKNNLLNEIEIDKSKLLKLKNSLERLINPNQSFDQKSFKIYISSNDELDENKLTPYYERVTGEVKNQIFDKLDFKTTFIESYITADGSQIITELKDKNEIIFRVIEKNVEFPLLKDIRINIYYLNPYAKGFFTKQTGIQPVEFGSIFLFLNGFRIPPYGDRGNDSFGLEVRKGQGTARYFSNREILGRIEIKDFENKFRVISSREGIVQNSYYKQLIRDSEKKSSKYNGFFYTTLKRLEKYVVDGLKWDSIPREMSEATIQKEIVDGLWNEKEVYRIDKKERLINSSDIIKQMLLLNSKNVVDLYINEDLIENLVEEDKERTEKKLNDFVKNFGSLSKDAFDEKTQKAIINLTKNIDDTKLSSELKYILTQNKIIENELEEEKKSKEELYLLFRKKAIEQKKKESEKRKKLKDELEKTQKENIKKDEQLTYLKTVQSKDVKELIAFQHHIGLYTKTAKDAIHDIMDMLKEKKPDINESLEYLKDASLELDKISLINKYITREDFLSTANKVKKDIIQFIYDYVKSIYEVTTNKELNITINRNSLEYVCSFEPIKINIIIDNLLNNSKKAKAKKVNIDLKLEDKDLILEYIDDGIGIDSSIVDINSIFEMGITTTKGSGLGLYHIKEILEEMKGSSIGAFSLENGIKFVIRLKV